MRTTWFHHLSTNWFRFLVFLAAVATWVIVIVLSGYREISVVLLLAIAGFSLFVAWLGGEQLKLRRNLEQTNVRYRESEHRLKSVIDLHHQLVEVEDEHSLVETALNFVSTLTGAVASSFVPLDEMGEPLSAIVHGNLPEKNRKAWSEHLASQLVRKTCSKCTEHHANAGQVCPLLVGPFSDAFSVYCMPLNRGEHKYGLLNVYFGPSHKINSETWEFLESMLQEMGNALQVVRLRGQEFATLRQLQLARTTRIDLHASLLDLLNNLCKAFGMDSAWLHTLPDGDRHPEIQVSRGNTVWTEIPEVQTFYKQVLRQEGSSSNGLADGTVIAAPLILPDSQVIGAVMLFSGEHRSTAANALVVLQAVAIQAALLIASERDRASLEFAIIIQERLRLAREIHDGLAQTMAYLKLQTAQMQRALAQNDIVALHDLLSQNYSALAEAYLDARQAIDNLRLNPQHGLNHWLDVTIKEFEQICSIPVHRTIEPVSTEIPSEVQVQLVRIVQEAFTNIRKHSTAKTAWLVLKECEGELILEVGDDGQGFQPDDIPILSQYGLRGMHERAELIGAELQVVSRPVKGTIIHLRLPARSWEGLL